MFTPIRIRGKNKRTKRAKKEQNNPTSSGNASSLLSPKKGRPRKRLLKQPGDGAKRPRATSPVSLPKKAATRTSTLSRIETLPTEILEKILLCSLNVGLPQASPYLGRPLDSDHVRTELVLRTFDPVTEETDPEGRGFVQSALLRQKWVTWPLLNKYHQTRLGRCAAAKLRELVSKHVPHVEECRVAEAELACAHYFYIDRGFQYYNTGKGSILLLGTVRDRVGTNHYSWKFEDKFVFRVSFGSWSSFSIEVEKDWKQVVDMDGPPLDSGIQETHHFHTCSSNLVIPEKILHGPWTQEKGNLLTDLLQVTAKIDWINSTSGEVASKGLEEAIREGNLHAMRALVFKDHYPFPDSEDNPSQFFRGSQRRRPPPCPGRFDPKGPWLCSSFPSWTRHSTVGVIPTTEHLRIAVIEMDCDPQMIHTLIGNATKWAIDWDDPEIVQWALADKAESHVPLQHLTCSKGEFLLHVLEYCRGKEKLRREQDQ